MFVLVLAACFLFAGTTHAQGDCGGGVQTCLDSYIENVFAHASNIDLICGDINIFVKCVLDLDCGLSNSEKDAIIDQAKGELSKQGIECTLDPHSATPRPSGGVTDAMDPCLKGIQGCLQTYMSSVFDNPNNVCSYLNTYMNCMFGVSACNMESVRQQVTQQVQNELQSKGLNCDIDMSGGGSNGGSGGPTTPVMTLQQIQMATGIKLQQLNCASYMDTCTNKYFDPETVMNMPESQRCSAVMKSGHCMMDSCPALDKKGDDRIMVADLLVKLAKAQFNCEFSQSEVQKLSGTDGGNGQTTIHGSFFLTLLVALVGYFVKTSAV